MLSKHTLYTIHTLGAAGVHQRGLPPTAEEHHLRGDRGHRVGRQRRGNLVCYV